MPLPNRYIPLLLLLFSTALWGQSVEKVRFRQTEEDKVVITYDIAGGEGITFEVSLSVSDDGGQNFFIIPRTVSGDVGKNVKGGRGKHIVWDVLSDIRRLEGEAFVFKVTAKTAGGLTLAGIEWVFVKGGTFQMGDAFGDGRDSEKPVHTVTVSDFYMSKYEVTVELFRKFVSAAGYKTDAEKGGGGYVYTGSSWDKKSDANWKNPYFNQAGEHPVVLVSWNDAVAFCQWLSRQTGATIRLPTEAEWEYAARSRGNKEKFAGTNNESELYRYANYADRSTDFSWSDKQHGDGYSRTAPVGSYRPNGLGLYDMSGNVWEWCADLYDSDYYKNSPRNNPRGPSSGASRVLRGGSWDDRPASARCSNRINYYPSSRHYYFGFRISRTF